jgi:hypothetical protein
VNNRSPIGIVLLIGLIIATGPLRAGEVQLASVHAAVGNLEDGTLLHAKNAGEGG